MILYRKSPVMYNGSEAYPKKANGVILETFTLLAGDWVLLHLDQDAGEFNPALIKLGDRYKVSKGETYVILEVTMLYNSSPDGMILKVIHRENLDTTRVIQDGTVKLEFPFNRTTITDDTFTLEDVSRFSIKDGDYYRIGNAIFSKGVSSQYFTGKHVLNDSFEFEFQSINTTIGLTNNLSNTSTLGHVLNTATGTLDDLYKISYDINTGVATLYKNDSIVTTENLGGAVRIIGQLSTTGRLHNYSFLDDTSKDVVVQKNYAKYQLSTVAEFYNWRKKYDIGDIVMWFTDLGTNEAYKKIKDDTWVNTIYKEDVKSRFLKVGLSVTNISYDDLWRTITVNIQGSSDQYIYDCVILDDTKIENVGNIAATVAANNGLISDTDNIAIKYKDNYYITSMSANPDNNNSREMFFHGSTIADTEVWEKQPVDLYWNYISPLNQDRCVDQSLGTETVFEDNDMYSLKPKCQYDFIALQQFNCSGVTVAILNSSGTIQEKKQYLIDFSDPLTFIETSKYFPDVDRCISVDDRGTLTVQLSRLYDSDTTIYIEFAGAGAIGNIFVGYGKELPCMATGVNQTLNDYKNVETNKISGLKYFNFAEVGKKVTDIKLTADADIASDVIQYLERNRREPVFVMATTDDKYRHLNHSGFIESVAPKTHTSYTAITMKLVEYENV